MNAIIAHEIETYDSAELMELAGQIVNRTGWIDTPGMNVFLKQIDADMREEFAYQCNMFLDDEEQKEEQHGQAS